MKPISEIVDGMDLGEALDYLIEMENGFVVSDSDINKIKAEAVREAFIDGAESFGVSRETAIIAFESSDSNIKLEKG